MSGGTWYWRAYTLERVLRDALQRARVIDGLCRMNVFVWLCDHALWREVTTLREELERLVRYCDEHALPIHDTDHTADAIMEAGE